MRVLLTGAKGQLGQALRASVPSGVDLIATARVSDPTRKILALDLSDSEACCEAVMSLRPDWVLNAGAYTAVDRAEAEPELARAVNAEAPKAFAKTLADTGGRLLQVSTDFVFSGHQSYPYKTSQSTDPLSVYGVTKALGEQFALESLGRGSEGRARILRTSWVYGSVGRNFLRTMLRLHRQKWQLGEPLLVVADQVGCPTATPGLSVAIWSAIDLKRADLMHWSDAGAASWYDFAYAIGELAVSSGLMPHAAEVLPIATVEFPTKAQRPLYSLLDCASTRRMLQLSQQHWRFSLEQVISSIDHE